ncbi:MAG TPA: bifunctional diguanylate cyclase/phosphodiesterase [Mizugakiibacter sp.]
MATLSLELVLFAAQSLGAVLQAAIFAYYFRVYRHPHLRLWGMSFAALALYLTLAWLATDLAGTDQGAPLVSARSVFTVLSLGAAYAQAVLVAFATYAAVASRPLPPRWLRYTMSGALAFAAVCALAFANDPAAMTQRALLRDGLRQAITAATYLSAAVVLWRFVRRTSMGGRIAAAALGLYGLEMLWALILLAGQAYTAHPLSWLRYTGVLDLAAQQLIGFGLVIWLLEDERTRAQKADQALRQLRDFDPVTGFPNRRRLLADLEMQLRQTNHRTAALLVRLDQADTLAGTLGVITAETLIAEAANRIESCAHPGWPRPARLSDDRIVQVVPRVSNFGDLATIADDLLAAIRAPFYDAGRELALSASVGIAVSPDDALKPGTLIAAAESACQRAHDEGGNRFQFFSAEMNALALTRLGLQAELRRALLHEEFELFYQPMFTRGAHRVCGAEALVRWRHPKRGVLLPALFMDEIEHLGLIEDLDRYVLENACREARLWEQRHGADIGVAVNISARSFEREHFPELVRNVLYSSGLTPHRLELEIVESSALGDADRTIECLHRLRALGVRVALDDFGTGYSSLSHLRQLPVDTLKIDRSFVDNVLGDTPDAAIVAAMITLARSLGLDVVAEGIETSSQLAWFEHHGVDRLQGFLFSQPLERDMLRQLVTEGGRPSRAAGS